MSESDQRTARLGRVAERSSSGRGSSGTPNSKRRTGRGGDRVERRQEPRPADATPALTSPTQAAKQSAKQAAKQPARRPRKARLRLTQVDAWSVMKTSFLLSIAMGIVTVVAVAIVWTVLGAAGVFDSLNNTVQTVMGNSFRVQDYVGTGRVLGFTMLVAVVDVVLITAIATLGAFLYNLSSTLLGGIEVTLTEDN